MLRLGGKCQRFSAGNLRHKNVTTGYRVNQYESQGRRLREGGATLLQNYHCKTKENEKGKWSLMKEVKVDFQRLI